MHNRRKIRVKVPASTSNLGSGFDTLGLALKLYNLIDFEVTASPLPMSGLSGLSDLELEVKGIRASSLSSRKGNKGNLVYQAALTLFDKAGYEPPRLKITLTNHIPIARGFGSSAVAILGGLLAANAICENRFSTSDILNLATQMEGHPDNVSASLLGGFVVSCVEDGKVHFVKVPVPKSLSIVFAVPNYNLYTKKAREILPKSVPFSDAVFNLSRSSLLVAAITSGDLQLLKVASQDKLHQPYRTILIPGLSDVFSSTLEAGALGVMLSGAGPSVMAFCDKNDTKEQQIAKNMKSAFSKHSVKCYTMTLEVDEDGAKVEEK